MRVIGRFSDWLDRLPLFWRFQMVGWLVFVVLSFPFKLIALSSMSYVVCMTLVREPLGVVMTMIMRKTYQRLGLFPGRPVRLAGWVLLICLVLGFLETRIWDIVNDTFFHLESKNPMVSLFYPRSLVYCSWSFLYFWIKDHLASRERLLALARAETAVREAELKMLRAQVSPHFLFNAFNTVLAGLDRNPEKLAPVVQSLADYFRYSLGSRHDMFVPVEEEFAAVVNYLTVEKARFRESLVVETYLDPAARQLMVPGVILQPLLENALKYGHLTSPTPLRISLRVEVSSAGSLVVEVSNSGHWIKEPSLRPRHDVGGSGLENLRRRLELLYPGNTVPAPRIVPCDGAVVVHLELPLSLATGEAAVS
jgi:hypothetical protein